MDMNNQTDERKPRFSAEQKQKMKNYAVFAAACISGAVFMWLIFAPSSDKKAGKEYVSGFNTDIPLPKEEGLISDKRDAYEQEQMKQKQAERMRSLEDFTAMRAEDKPKQSKDLALLNDDVPSSPVNARGKGSLQNRPEPSIKNSAQAYRDMSRTLGSFYETPRADPEKERLRKELEDLKQRMDETENRKRTTDDQLDLMEKSFQMAAKYIPVKGSTTDNATQETVKTAVSAPGKNPVVPVTQLVEQTVSALPQEIPDKDLIQALTQPRNRRFFTATAELPAEGKNTIAACVLEDRTVMDGESIRLRLLEPMHAGKTPVRENTILSGFAKIQGQRLQITVNSLEYNGIIIPVDISVYDTDGQRGIFIPDTQELNAAKEMAANMGTNAGTSISLSSDAGEQLAADMGRSFIQGVSQFFSKKMHEVKVHLKAGYRVFLVES